MLNHKFSRLAVVLILSVLTAGAVESFAPSPPVRGYSALTGLVHGDGWLAYRTDSDKVHVADRNTGQVILTLNRPPDTRPGASFTVFGRLLAADGNRLAVVSETSAYFAPSISLFEIPGGTLIGSDLFRGSGDVSHVGLANGRLLATDLQGRKVWMWDATTMAPLPTLSVPEGFPAPFQMSFAGGKRVDSAGDRLVYYSPSHYSPNNRPMLVNVDLVAGTFSSLPLPGDFLDTSVGSGFAMNGNHLVFPCRTGGASPIRSLLHYDLASSQLSGRSDFTEVSNHHSPIRPVVAKDGHWHAAVYAYGGDVELISGRSAGTAYEARIHLGSFGDHVGAPHAFVDGKIWLLPTATSTPGVISYHMAGGGLPETKLSGTCLPCHESEGVLKVKVSLSDVTAEPVSFRLRSFAGSASSSSDFIALNEVFTIPAGQTGMIVEVPLIRDQVIEGNESLFFAISEPSANALVVDPEFAGVIGASSFHLLPPVAPWDGGPSAKPSGVSLAGGRLIQTNQRTGNAASNLPALVIRPFASGDWVASANWGRAIPADSGAIRFLANGGGRALLREYSAVTVFDPAGDQVIFRLSSSFGDGGKEAFSESHLISGMGADSTFEYPLEAPHVPRIPGGSELALETAAYTSDYLIMTEPNGVLRKYSRADGSDLGTLFTAGPWGTDYPGLAADGNVLALSSGNRVWLCEVADPVSLRELTPLEGSFAAVAGIEADGGRIYVTDLRHAAHPVIRVFEASTGVEIDVLLEDLAATLLPGAAELPGSLENPRFRLAPFAVEGSNAVVSFEWDGFRIARFALSGDLPSLARPEPLREGDGSLKLRLAEAAPWPVTVTTRVVAAGINEDADWSGSGAAVVVPAGTTDFDSGLALVDDRIPEDDHPAVLEVTMTGNGQTGTLRLSISLTDNDLMDFAELPWVELPVTGRVFAPVGDGWAYQTTRDGNRMVAWTGDGDFLQGSPAGAPASYAFAAAMAGSGGWLAVAQDNYGPKLGIERPSMVYLYQPGTRKPPVFAIKGKSYLYRFGEELHARGDRLFIGAPGSEALIEEGKSPPGMVQLHDIRSGKKLRTFKAPKGKGMSFGEAITSNDRSVWIAAPYLADRAGEVFQFSLGTGKMERSISSPSPAPGRYFGREMVATEELLVVSSPPTSAPDPEYAGSVQVFSATTGAHLWTVIPNAGERIGDSLEILPGNILAVGGSHLSFYELDGAAAPGLIVRVKGAGAYQMQLNGEVLLLQANDVFGQTRARALNLRDVPQLLPYLTPGVASASAGKAALLPNVQPLSLSRTNAGWALALPSAGFAPGNATLEVSADLKDWTRAASPDAAGAWQLVTGHGIQGAELSDGRTLHFDATMPARFFRIRLW